MWDYLEWMCLTVIQCDSDLYWQMKAHGIQLGSIRKRLMVLLDAVKDTANVDKLLPL